MRRPIRVTDWPAAAPAATTPRRPRKRAARADRASTGTAGSLLLQSRQSHLEAQMWQQIVSADLDVGCVREHVYVPWRKFRYEQTQWYRIAEATFNNFMASRSPVPK